MAHPHKSEAASAHTAKMRNLTEDYGSASGPANNITSPQERLKGEAGETHVGFGADSANASAKRGDRPARRAVAANPVATYARGGKVKHRDDGGAIDADKQSSTQSQQQSQASGMNGVAGRKVLDEYNTPRAKGGRTKHREDGGDVSAIEKANREQNESAPRSTGGVIARARGGRMHHGKKGSTHVNVIVAPQGGAGGPPPGAGPSPQRAALAAGAHPPMGGPPMMPPPGAGGPPGGPPMMPPGGPGGPPPMMPRARGGKVMGDHPDASQDKELIEKTLREEGLVRKAKGGGITMHAGAVTGIGRLEKMGKHPPLHKGSMKPEEI